MFLVNLKNMKQRKAFCNLAMAAINSDGKQDIREIVILQNLVKEMIIHNDIDLEDSKAFSKYLLDNIPKEKLEQKDIDKNLEVFVDTSIHIKKTVLFELIALAYSDKDLSLTEKELIELIACKFDFSNELITEMLNIIVSLNSSFENIANIIQN